MYVCDIFLTNHWSWVIIWLHSLRLITALSAHETDIRLRPAVRDGQLFDILRCNDKRSYTGTRDLVHHSIQHALFEQRCSFCSLSPIVALKDPSSARFWLPERMFDDWVVTSLDIFSYTVEQQQVHFHLLGRRWKGYLPARRSYNDRY